MAVPVTVLSGTLGVGKTTLLNHVLDGDHGHDVAVLVNDMGEINVDAQAIERRVEDDREVVELSNGCICCGIQSEFERAIADLALGEEFDYLLVEPSGISDPKSVAQQFAFGHAAQFYTLGSVTTVVDARQFYDAFEAGRVERRGETDAGDRPLSDLIVDGVEFCDAIVLNKTDLVDEDERQTVRELLRTLQPEATVIETEYGRVDPDTVLGPDRFDPDAVADAAGWKQALQHHQAEGTDQHGHEHDDHQAHDDHGDDDQDHGDHGDDDHDHAHPPERYGIDSFLYSRRPPMNPQKLADALESLPESVVRAKGFLHVAGRLDHALTMSLAGPQTQVDVAGRWIASLPDDRQQRHRDAETEWDEQYGDRHTELVFIGKELDRENIERQLDDCLVDEHEPYEANNLFPEREGNTLTL